MPVGRFCPRARDGWWIRAVLTLGVVVLLGVWLPGCASASSSSTTTSATTVATGVIRYVASGGSDRHAGTAAAPWRTLAHAVAASPRGATIIVAPGRYPGFTAVHRRGLTITGTADEPAPVIAPRPGTGTVNTIELIDCRRITLTHLTVTGARGHYEAGVDIERGRQIVLRDDTLVRNVGFGVDASDSVDVAVLDSRAALNATGVQLTRTRRATVDHDTIFRNDRMIDDSPVPDTNRGANAVVAYDTPGPIWIEDDVAWGNIAPSRNYGYDGGAFEISNASHVTMSGNALWDNNNVSETGTAPGGQCLDNRFVDNDVVGGSPIDQSLGLILRCAAGMVVADNHFCGLDDFTVDITAGPVPFGGSIDGLQVTDNSVASTGSKVYSIDSALPSSVVVDDTAVTTLRDSPLAYVAGFGQTDSLQTFRTWSGLVGARSQTVAGSVSCPLPDSLTPQARARADQKISPSTLATATASASATSRPRRGRTSRA